MQTKANITRWASATALFAVCAGAGAQSSATGSVLWVENESFGFNACATAPAAQQSDAAAAALSALRARAAADIEAALHSGGVALGGQQYMTLTPTSGTLACADVQSQVTFRVSAVDRSAGKFWSKDMLVRSDSRDTDRDAVAALGIDLAQHFRGVQYKSAKL